MASLLGGTFFLLLRTAVNGDFSFQGDTLAWAGLREGEALGVSEGRLPFSRSSPPGHAVVLRCGDVILYWQDDGFYCVGCEALCRFLSLLSTDDIPRGVFVNEGHRKPEA